MSTFAGGQKNHDVSDAHRDNTMTFSTRSSSLVTSARPFTSSSVRITDRSFQYASHRLWNHLPASLRQRRTNLSNPFSGVRTYKRGTVNRGTVKRGQLIAGQLIARTHNRSDN